MDLHPIVNDAVKKHVRDEFGSEWLDGYSPESITEIVLASVPDGWAKVGGTWVQIKRAGSHHTAECMAAQPDWQHDGFGVGEDERCICREGGVPIYEAAT